jgi:Tfp pilus assembly protein PilV
MVTTVILGIIILPIVRMILFSVWGTEKTKDHVIAFNLARDKMERVRMLDFDNITNEENDIYTENNLDKDPDSEEFKKNWQEKYLMEYTPWPEELGRFTRTVHVDPTVDTVHENSILKKIRIEVVHRPTGKIMYNLVTLVTKY